MTSSFVTPVMIWLATDAPASSSSTTSYSSAASSPVTETDTVGVVTSLEQSTGVMTRRGVDTGGSGSSGSIGGAWGAQSTAVTVEDVAEVLPVASTSAR